MMVKKCLNKNFAPVWDVLPVRQMGAVTCTGESRGLARKDPANLLSTPLLNKAPALEDTEDGPSPRRSLG